MGLQLSIPFKSVWLKSHTSVISITCAQAKSFQAGFAQWDKPLVVAFYHVCIETQLNLTETVSDWLEKEGKILYLHLVKL